MAVRETNMREGFMNDFPVLAGKKIEKGALVFAKAATGYAFGISSTDTGTAGDRFLGVACETVDNTGGASGALVVRAWGSGVHQFATAGFTVADTGKKAKTDLNGAFSVAASTYQVGTIVVATSSQIDIDIETSIGSVFA